MACTPHRSDQIAALAAGRLDADAADELLGHLDACDACSSALDLAADAVAGLARAPVARRRWPLVLVAAAAAAAALLLLAKLPAGAPDVTELARLEPLAPDAELVLRAGSPRATEGARRAADDAYRAARWSEAAAAYAEVVGAEPVDALAWLYLGMARAQLGGLEDAAAAFERAEEHGRGLVRERARWFLANVHLARGDAAAARSVLDRTVAEDGDYAPNAEALLGRLDELER